MIYVAAVLCVIGMATGQILFKVSASAWTQAGTFFAWRPLLILCAAMMLYGIISIAWVWILQRVELGRVYPFMALSFVLVPLGSHFLFDERFNTQYFIGIAFIMMGIVVAGKS
ncbi:4-amino-4-deoxy-L-arabinose-phospho-UDP flippase [Achromobacter denitrificans]|nr:4-amino-4-deoxy-L-arabinose-phospho-UDP flippase [Achromobacter denitrificans]